MIKTEIKGTIPYMSPKMYNAYISSNSNNNIYVIHNPFYSDAFSLVIVMLEMMEINPEIFNKWRLNINNK